MKKTTAASIKPALIWCWLLFCCAGLLRAAPTPTSKPIAPVASTPAPTPAATSSPTPLPTPTPAPTPVPGVALAEIAPRGQEALATIKGFEADNNVDQSAKEIREGLPALTKSIDDLHDQTTVAVENTATSLDTLRGLQVGWHKVIDTLVEHSNSLGERGRTLEAEAAKIKDLDKLWNDTLTSVEAKDSSAPPETVSLVRDVLYNSLLAGSRVKYRQNNILDLQNAIGALLARANSGQDVVDQAVSRMVKTLLVRDSPPIWASEAQPKPDLPGRWRAAYAEQKEQIHRYLDENQGLFGLHLLIFFALIGVFLLLRRLIHRWTEDEPHLKRAAPIFDVPVAAALAVSFLALGGRYDDAPNLLQAVVAAAALLPTVIILHRLLSQRLFPVLCSLVLFTVMDQIRVATVAFPAINRWLYCFEVAAASGVFLWLLRAQKSGDKASRLALGRWMPLLCGAAVVIFVTAFGATVLGYLRLGSLLGSAALKSSYSAVFLFAALRVLDGLIVIALRVRPVSASRIAQTHRDTVQTQVYTVFRAAAVLLWLKYTLEQLQLAKPLTSIVRGVLTHEISLGALQFSLSQLLWFGAAIWLSLLISRVLRFLLNEEVYERVQLAPGLPYAISTMLNYTVLLVGFVVALGLSGIPFAQFTILAGAFSVGLGFGLQNIINNFVSGIILLFERPVKVGDVIQLGDSTGEVRRIGIRASIIRTRDGSDIIVPNGNLISNQVTNWTYADRTRAVEITLNIAAGPEPQRVMDLLKTAATREPITRDRPAPEVFVTALLASGFTVVVRAWTSRYEDWIAVRSELNVTLHNVLARESIKLV